MKRTLLGVVALAVVGRRARRRRLDDVADLGPGQPRRRPAGRRDRRPRRGPVQRPAVADLRGPPRPRDRPVRGGPRAVPRRDRRQGRRATGRPRRRPPAPTPSSKGVPADAILVEDQGRTTLESLRGGRGDPPRPRPRDSAVFVIGPDPHAARPADRPRRGDRGVRLADARRARPTRRSASRVEATLHELGGLALYFVARPRRRERRQRPAASVSAWRTSRRRRTRIATETARVTPVLPLGVGDRRTYTPGKPHAPRDRSGSRRRAARRAPILPQH